MRVEELRHTLVEGRLDRSVGECVTHSGHGHPLDGAAMELEHGLHAQGVLDVDPSVLDSVGQQDGHPDLVRAIGGRQRLQAFVVLLRIPDDLCEAIAGPLVVGEVARDEHQRDVRHARHADGAAIAIGTADGTHEGGVAAVARPEDADPLRVHPLLIDDVLHRRIDVVLDSGPPLTLTGLEERPSVAGRSPVVHLQHPVAPAREVLGQRVEAPLIVHSDRAPVWHDHERRSLAIGRPRQDRLHPESIGRGHREELGGDEALVHELRSHTAEHPVLPGGRVDEVVLPRIRRARHQDREEPPVATQAAEKGALAREERFGARSISLAGGVEEFVDPLAPFEDRDGQELAAVVVE